MGVVQEFKAKDYATFVGTFCGVLALFAAFEYQAYRGACFMVILGIAADLLDGYIARRTQTFNQLGMELDSLSDSFVFGITPALIAYTAYTEGPEALWGIGPMPGIVMIFPTFIFIVGAIARLAWFNVREEDDYEGIPTPISASALVLAMLLDYFVWFLNESVTWFNKFMFYFIPIWMVILAYCNITTKIRYGNRIRKKSGNMKYVFLLLTVCIGALIVLTRFFREETRTIILVIITLLNVLQVYWIGVGFKRGLKLQDEPVNTDENSKKETKEQTKEEKEN